MSAPTAKKGKPPKNVVRHALRTATNRPPRSCAHCLDLIAEYADHVTGRNAFMSVGTLMKRLRRGERQTRAMMARLRGGGWIAEQNSGPDAHAVAAYHRLYPDPRHRPPVYCIVLPTLSCPRGAESAPLTVTIKGCGNGHGRGAETDTEGVRVAAPIPSFITSEPSALRAVTDSLQSLTMKLTPPPRAGGSDLSAPTSSFPDSAAEDDDFPFPSPTTTEIRRAMDEALRILDQSASAFTPYYDRAKAALRTLTEDGTTCLVCALLVPYWVALDEDTLKGLNQRTNLAHLWGPEHGRYITDALKSFAPRRGADLFDRAEANIYKDSDRPDEEWKTITMFCSTCKRRNTAADRDQEMRRQDRRDRLGLP